LPGPRAKAIYGAVPTSPIHSINAGHTMTATLVRFARDDSGATAVEYGLIAVTNSFLNIGNKL